MNTKIIVVEDIDEIRTLLKMLLTSKGFEVIEAADGLQGLDAFRNNKDAVLVMSDVSMPEMTGDRLIEIIKNEQPDMKIILMSSDEKESANPNASRFMSKPFTASELFAVLSDLKIH